MPEKQTRLYTRDGDDGYTYLLRQEQVPKYDLRPEAYGTVDEASSFMGLVRAEAGASPLTKKIILQAQRDLWLLMSELAASSDLPLPKRLTADRVDWLEAQINQLNEQIPPLNQFVVPGDTMISARLDVARAVVRRAERYVVRLLHQGLLENPQPVRYLNRLSSLLFALARYEEARAGYKTTLVKDVQ